MQVVKRTANLREPEHHCILEAGGHVWPPNPSTIPKWTSLNMWWGIPHWMYHRQREEDAGGLGQRGSGVPPGARDQCVSEALVQDHLRDGVAGGHKAATASTAIRAERRGHRPPRTL